MIYSLKYKEFSNMLREFGKTVYGKAMFLICYTPFFLGLILCIKLALTETIDFLSEYDIIVITFFTIVMLCIGSYGYYNQLRIFVEKTNSQKEK
jgi:isoprenylcysteine carboxyl methyltransferase (ICMT) family protein YpbQ